MSAVDNRLRDLDKRRACRLAALERFALEVQAILATDDGTPETDQLIAITAAHARLIWSRP